MTLRFAGNKRALEQKRIAIAQYNAMWPVTMKAVNRSMWPDDLGVFCSQAEPLAVWRSKYFTAVLYQEVEKSARRLSVCRTQLNDAGELADGITWDDLMRVKSECGFGAQDAIEIYPRDVDVVNVANLRHLWILPVLSDLAWRNEAPRP